MQKVITVLCFLLLIFLPLYYLWPILSEMVPAFIPDETGEKNTVFEPSPPPVSTLPPISTPVPTSTPTPEPEPEPVETPRPWTDEEVIVLAKMLWGEARGVPSDTEKAACVWCALNRVDQGQGSVIEVVTAPYQFMGYREDNPVDPGLQALCEDVLARWYREKDGETDVGRVLPSDYLFFSGDGLRNHFRNAYRGGDTWDWSYESPYES